MNNFGIKLKEARLACGLKQEQLAALIGVKTGNCICNWERGISHPDNVMLTKICTALNISADSLLGINVDAFVPTATEIRKIEKYRLLDEHGKTVVDFILDKEFERVSASNKKKPRKHMIKLDYYTMPVSAGTGNFLDDNSAQEILVVETPESEMADFVLEVSGDSMEPDFHDGDKVLVSSQPAVDEGEIGIFILNGDAYIKELGNNELISHNPAYKPIRIRPDDSIYCCGKVIGGCEI